MNLPAFEWDNPLLIPYGDACELPFEEGWAAWDRWYYQQEKQA
jgi:hypothetical protein